MQLSHMILLKQSVCHWLPHPTSHIIFEGVASFFHCLKGWFLILRYPFFALPGGLIPIIEKCPISAPHCSFQVRVDNVSLAEVLVLYEKRQPLIENPLKFRVLNRATIKWKPLRVSTLSFSVVIDKKGFELTELLCQSYDTCG